ncbi:hypothetical protein ABT232_27020 [Streptomyces sp. NPDC001532]|uniref:hypothetical protein n=1 Tax=Streptomyces sp. NPDC001532 TaxID=3154520 RepID=UPI00333470C4
MTYRATTPHPSRIPGYDSGPLTHRPGLLDEGLFWLSHLHTCAANADADELLLGDDEFAASDFQRQLLEGDEWPVLTVPVAGGHRFHIVYRAVEDDPGIDYLLHHPDWERAEILAQDDGHYTGPALSWPELCAVADSGLPGGSTADPHARLLLLLPAFGDEAVPDDAVGRLAAALAARTAVAAPEPLAAALLEGQGAAGPVRWSSLDGAGRVDDGDHSFRNPANHFALPPARLARVSAALDPRR